MNRRAQFHEAVSRRVRYGAKADETIFPVRRSHPAMASDSNDLSRFEAPSSSFEDLVPLAECHQSITF